MTSDDLKQIDVLFKKNLKGFATKKDLHNVATKKDVKVVESRLGDVDSRMTTKDDLKNFATKKDLQQFATKKDLQSLEVRLQKNIKNNIDDAVAQIVSVISPLEERVVKIEDRLGIINP